MKKSEISCPFSEVRTNIGFGEMDDQNDPVTMLLRHKDVRKGAHDWKTFQSGSTPGRIVIPSEVNIRTTRQIPFEVDPPQHKSFRDILDPWFKRPLEEKYQAKLTAQISALVDEVLAMDSVDVISEFALKLQSRALTLLLNTAYDKSDLWISWGTHVFRSEGEALDGDKAAILYDYIDAEIDKAIANPGPDLYSVLLASEVDGTKLTKEEVKGVMILTFAGGRDTVINAVSNSLAYLADNPKSLERLREEPEIRNRAIEELIRYYAPLTQMGRVVTEDTTVCEHAIKADTRISLVWASANRDEKVFENANEVVLDRKMNPHLSFGFGTHNCLGATHARTIMKVLIEVLTAKVQSMEIISAEENIEELGEFKRKVGFHALQMKFNKK
ncbi:cytochrome [Flavobacterium faecale]|uniref:Cytochrome n=1 Tax=Flavobacterium faecale TaxID=1355330 RepID=A0A2S1LGF8_9FLAO|nr:cytochrome P450 [Flavobacterium faecale]AWG22741.1 cytochrome [Flavobacterium faecale]